MEAEIPKPMSDGSMYGYRLEAWNRLTPEQKQGAADMFRLAYPELAIPEGAREILETSQLTKTKLGRQT